MKISLKNTKIGIENDPDNWLIHFMDFVDEFRRNGDPSMIDEPFEFTNERLDAILASTVEYLCNELNIKTPDWIWEVPGCKNPWFVSGIENLKAITIVESPAYFRRRKIFVLENFLDRA